MRSIVSSIIISLICFSVYSNNDTLRVKQLDSEFSYKVAVKDLVDGLEDTSLDHPDSSFWFKRNIFTFDISEVAFVNWNAGGTNSISGLLGLEVIRNFKKGNIIWESRGLLRYGMNKQEETELRKTDDLFQINSTVGYKKDSLSNWYSSANFSFKTQLSPGYDYSNDSQTKVSEFMAPAYLFLGAGTVYGKNVDELAVYLSPLTLKSTFVLDQELANLGSFGVNPAEYDEDGNLIKEGENTRTELGILIRNRIEREITENVFFRNYLSLYTDYINNFGNIDIDWEVIFDFRINNFLRATFGSHLLFDDDVKFYTTLDDGTVEVSDAKVQWKQHLGIGVIFDI